LAASHGARWSACGAAVVDTSWELLGVREVPTGDLTSRLLSGNAVPGGGSGVVAASELVRALGGFDPELSMLADWDMWTRLALASRCALVPELGVVTVRHDGNMSLQVAGARRELDRIGEKHAAARRREGVAHHDHNMQRWTAWSHA